MLLFFVLFLALLLPGLFWKALLRIELHIHNGVYYLRFELRFFYALLHLRYERQLESSDVGTWSYFVQNNSLLRIFLKKKKKKTGEKIFRFRDGVHIRFIRLEGELGISGEAYATAMLTGALSILLRGVSCFYKIPVETCLRPDFEKGVCRMKLESILELRTTQIMTAALKRRILKIRGKKHAASN